MAGVKDKRAALRALSAEGPGKTEIRLECLALAVETRKPIEEPAAIVARAKEFEAYVTKT